jgi:hypothetical protein
MAGEKDPFRAAEAQAKQQQHERQARQGEEPQQPTTADFEAYDEEIGDKVEGIGGASAGGPAV